MRSAVAVAWAKVEQWMNPAAARLAAAYEPAASAVRHPGIAMMLANANFADKRVTAAILLFLLVGLVIGTIYKAWIRRSAAGRAKLA